MATWKPLLLQQTDGLSLNSATLIISRPCTSYLSNHYCISWTITSYLFFNKFINRYFLEGQLIEIIWTVLPAVTLIFIALPSLRLIYILDEINNPLISIKAIGHQWYWSYEYSDFKNIEFDSYMVPINEMKHYNFRLLGVGNRVVVPYQTQVPLLVSAADVIHSWTVPSFGVKIDATPGQINQVSFSTSRASLFYGQCSEICGANYSFMPIVVESVSPEYFIKWIHKA